MKVSRFEDAAGYLYLREDNGIIDVVVMDRAGNRAITSQHYFIGDAVTAMLNYFDTQDETMS